ncbi:MAG: SPOR domain-containing protein [Candidatus Binatia bacterium]
MVWVRIICFAAALAWTGLMFLAYSDLGLAFRASLIGWLICGVGWVARLTLAHLVKTAQLSKKLKMLHPRYLVLGGAVVGVFALSVLTGQWLGKSGNFSTAVRSVAEPPSRKPKLPAKDQAKANGTATQKTEGLWSVQVGAFRSEQDAIRLSTALKDKGWEAYVTSADVKGVTFYRANVGRFRTREAAQRLLLKLKDKEAYTTAFVVSM